MFLMRMHHELLSVLAKKSQPQFNDEDTADEPGELFQV
jgi:hypothetical protein